MFDQTFIQNDKIAYVEYYSESKTQDNHDAGSEE